MDSRDRNAWLRWSRRLLLLADDVAREIQRRANQPPDPPTELEGYFFLAISYGRRVYAAIRRLSGEHDFEAGILLRVMIELSVNSAWIAARDPKERAGRFFRYESHDRIRSMEKFPEEWRSKNFDRLRREMESYRDAFGSILRKDGDKGWQKTWALDEEGKPLDDVYKRLVDLGGRSEEERKRAAKNYFGYQELHPRVHAGPRAFRALMPRDLGPGRLVLGKRPLEDPIAPIVLGAATLLDVLALAINELGLGPDLDRRYDAERTRYRALVGIAQT